jgi:hypothetical protein
MFTWINHSRQTSFAALPAYLPTIIQNMGYTSLNSQGLSAPPYLAAYFVCLVSSFVSDRLAHRGLLITFFCCIGAIGYIILATVDTTGVRYFATYLACAGVFPAVSLTFTWVTDNQGSASKRGAGLVLFGMIGQCGPILGARLYPTEEGPIYAKGMGINAGLLFFAAILSVVLSGLMWKENKRRDKEYGAVEGGPGAIPMDVGDLGDSHPQFRFIL